MASGLGVAECGAIVGVVVVVLTFVFGVIKIRAGSRRNGNSGNPGKFVLKVDYDNAHSELAIDIKDIREEQVLQGKILARVDERTRIWAKNNGIKE